MNPALVLSLILFKPYTSPSLAPKAQFLLPPSCSVQLLGLVAAWDWPLLSTPLLSMSLYLPASSTRSKCQQVNGYTTVQTALGHSKPKRKKEKKKNPNKKKKKKTTRNITTMFSFVGVTTSTPILWFYNLWSHYWIGSLCFWIKIFRCIYKVYICA